MSNIFNSRFDIVSCVANSDSIWTVSGRVVDNTGDFSSVNVLVGDVIYNNGAAQSKGPLRYKIISIQQVTGSTIIAHIQWDLDESSQTPLSGEDGLIGRPDVNGVIPITDASTQGISETFVNSVRNMESILLSKKLNNIILPTGVMMQQQYDKDADLRINPESLPDIDLGTF